MRAAPTILTGSDDDRARLHTVPWRALGLRGAFNWSAKLSRTLTLKDGTKLVTLDDARREVRVSRD